MILLRATVNEPQAAAAGVGDWVAGAGFLQVSAQAPQAGGPQGRKAE